MAGLKKDVNVLLARLQSPGYDCTVTTGGTGHWRVKRPGHQPITISCSPRDRRALANIHRDIRVYLGIDLRS